MNPAAAHPIQFTDRERASLAKLVDYTAIRSLPEIWPIASQRFPDVVALQDPHNKPALSLTYAQLHQQIQQFAAGLQSLGVTVGDRLSLFADNSPRWLIADQGTMTAGAANAVRGSLADRDELLFILANSGSKALIIENLATFSKISDRFQDLPLQFVVLLSDESVPEMDGLKLLNFPQLMELGATFPLQPASQTEEMLATLLYTSGTTGKPKGVMLTHGNLLHQVKTFGTVLQPEPGDRVLSILPTWHCYERTVEYFMLSQGCTQIYTSIRYIKQDLKQFKPSFMIGVPRLWESIYEGVQKQLREQPANKQKQVNFFLNLSQRYITARRIVQGFSLETPHPSPLKRLTATLQATALEPLHALADRLIYQKVRAAATGGELKQVISGGGSLAKHLDTFYEIIGVEVLVGYGLTETSPVTNVRRVHHNVRGSSGLPMPGTQVRIIDLETRKPLPQGQKGLVTVRGPQVMPGYYQNPEATAKAIDPEGWFDTGDLGYITHQNDLVITGRAKDTIVLTNGENIEPQPIEDACLRSPYIDQIMLVGQDQKFIGALIVPNLEALQKWQEAEKSGPSDSTTVDLASKPIQDLFRRELDREVKNRPGYRPDDRILVFRLLPEPFSQDNGMMTQTLKIRRPVVTERYQGMIIGMFA